MTNKQSNQIDASLKPDTRIKKQQHFNLRSIEHSDVDTIATGTGRLRIFQFLIDIRLSP